MNTYKVTAPMGVTLHTGRVKLTADQYRRRKHAVEPVKGAEDVYQIRDNTSIMFKNGEQFGYYGTVSKGFAESLVDTASGKTVGALNRESEDAKKAEVKKKADEKGAADKKANGK